MALTTLPIDVMGLRVAGDVGGLTCYTAANYKKVFYQKAPPQLPASPRQRQLRDRFARAVQAWKILGDSDKAALERAVAKTSLCLTGQNLFVSCSICRRDQVYETIARQANESLPPLATNL